MWRGIWRPSDPWRCSCRSLDVLQADLAAGDELVVVGAADLDLPEPLRAALLNGLGDDGQRRKSTMLVTPIACWARSLPAS
jgi:hypothetical protein